MCTADNSAGQNEFENSRYIFSAGETCWCPFFFRKRFFLNFHELENAKLWTANAHVSAQRKRETAALDYFQLGQASIKIATNTTVQK